MAMLTLALTLTLLQSPTPPQAARSWRETHEHEIVAELRELLAIPNISRDRASLRRNADWIVAAFKKRGVAMRLLEVSGANPVVYGELPCPGAERTYVFYVHYDGQPVDPARWASPPFEPTLRDGPVESGGKVIRPTPGQRLDPSWRIYARSAGDDKAPILAILAALDALKAAKLAPKSNLKFFFEGEEEIGSIHLRQILRKHKELLAADAWLFCDGPVHQNRRQQVVFGVRGVTGLEITVYGPRAPLHSGHYGNWAPNPGAMLVRLLASMRDDDGDVLIDGFYDQVAPLTESEQRALAAAPDFDEPLMQQFWLARHEGKGKRLDELLTRPSFNIRGLSSATVGATARNIVPSTATASIDIRLVKGMDPKRTLDTVVAHIEKRGYQVVFDEPGRAERLAHQRVAWVRRRKGYPALRTSMDLPIARRIVAAVESAHGPVIRMPTLGGSLPLSVFDEELRTPVVIVPIANHDDNQHAPNENLRLANLWAGIETMAALLAMD